MPLQKRHTQLTKFLVPFVYYILVKLVFQSLSEYLSNDLEALVCTLSFIGLIRVSFHSRIKSVFINVCINRCYLVLVPRTTFTLRILEVLNFIDLSFTLFFASGIVQELRYDLRSTSILVTVSKTLRMYFITTRYLSSKHRNTDISFKNFNIYQNESLSDAYFQEF